MNVVHLATAKSWRGGEQQVLYLIEELQKLNVKQLVICSKDSEMERRCKKRGFTYKALKRKSSFDPIFAAGVRREA